jgi:hypothetical protein
MTPATIALAPAASVAPTLDARRLLPWLLGAAALALSFVINLYTGRYVDSIGPTLAPARDLLFQVLPQHEMPLVHVWGFTAFTITLGVGLLVAEPRGRVPLVLWAYGLIITTRAVFTTLTPIGVPLEAPSFEHYPLRGIVQYFDFRHTMFFSGHTGFPFLGFLLCRTPWVRRACLFFSLLLATCVLLSRLHYSIDVFAAFFIAFGVSRIAERSFAWLVPAAPGDEITLMAWARGGRTPTSSATPLAASPRA